MRYHLALLLLLLAGCGTTFTADDGSDTTLLADTREVTPGVYETSVQQRWLLGGAGLSQLQLADQRVTGVHRVIHETCGPAGGEIVRMVEQEVIVRARFRCNEKEAPLNQS